MEIDAPKYGWLTLASGATRLVAMSALLGMLPCFLPIVMIASASVGADIGRVKNAGGYGFLLGLFFGPFGWIGAGLIDKRPKCPACGTRLNLLIRKAGRLTYDGYPHCPSCKSRLTWNGGTPELAPQRPKTPAGV